MYNPTILTSKRQEEFILSESIYFSLSLLPVFIVSC
jgi:hypothetical protein